MGNPNDYDTSQFPDDHRPNLQPTDPRRTASPGNDVEIHGSIDNESHFNLGTGKSTRSPH